MHCMYLYIVGAHSRRIVLRDAQISSTNRIQELIIWRFFSLSQFRTSVDSEDNISINKTNTLLRVSNMFRTLLR